MQDTLDARIVAHAASAKNYRVAQALLEAVGVASRAMDKQPEFEDLVRTLVVAAEGTRMQSGFEDQITRPPVTADRN